MNTQNYSSVSDSPVGQVLGASVQRDIPTNVLNSSLSSVDSSGLYQLLFVGVLVIGFVATFIYKYKSAFKIYKVRSTNQWLYS